MNTSISPRMTIGVAARRAEVSIDTIRYYERAGLLPVARRRVSGYRDYDDATVERLRFIRRAKRLGFTLAEIRDLLALSTDRERGVRGVKQHAQARLDEIDQRICELRVLRGGLQHLIDACPGRGKIDACPILRALGEGEMA